MALLKCTHYAETLSMNCDFYAVLPENAVAPYKTVYLLHGLSDNSTCWLRYTSCERYAKANNLALIMPDGGRSFYTDMKKGSKYYSYLTEELPVQCERFFPSLSTKREDRFIAGLSMGGYGALKAALNSNLFSKCAAFSAVTDIKARMNTKDRRSFFEDIFGTEEEFTNSINDIYFTAKEKTTDKPQIFMSCGTEDELYKENLDFYKHLISLGYDIKSLRQTGGHTWDNWDTACEIAFKWFLEV
ncbi:MAG: alpha/beta hydrolase family protein [Eubacteriales bacterium]|nr:alpha/beta hydrolase family protein [Eubacteriales bacterium]